MATPRRERFMMYMLVQSLDRPMWDHAVQSRSFFILIEEETLRLAKLNNSER
jgi:hypothetical protein